MKPYSRVEIKVENTKPKKMKTSYKEKLRMYNAVNDVLDNFQTNWSVVPAIQGIRDEFLEQLTQLRNLAFEQSFIANNAGDIKNKRRLELLNVFLIARRSLKSFAKSTDNNALFLAMKFSRTSFTNASSFRTLQIANLITNKAIEYEESLADYGLSSNFISQLNDLLEELERVLELPRKLITDRKAITASIESLVPVIDNILIDELDPLVKNLEASDETFANKYFNARVIFDIRTFQNGVSDFTEDVPEERDDGFIDFGTNEGAA